MSRGYRIVHGICVALVLLAGTTVLCVYVPLVIERISRANGWKDTHWSAAGTIAAAFAATAGVIFSLIQNRQQRDESARQRSAAEQEHRTQEKHRLKQEEHDAVQAILRAVSTFTAKVTASAEAMLAHETHMNSRVPVFRPRTATVDTARADLLESQDIIRYRTEAMLVSSEATTTTFVALQKIHTLAVKRVASRLLSEVDSTARHVTGASGRADWRQAQEGVASVAELASDLMSAFQAASRSDLN